MAAVIISAAAASLRLLGLNEKKIRLFKRFAPITQKRGIKKSLKKESCTSLTFVRRLKLRIKLTVSLTKTTII